MRKLVCVILAALAIGACTAAGDSGTVPTEPATTTEASEAGPCVLSDDEAPCVRWRRTGFVAASSDAGIVVVAGVDGALQGLDAENGDVLWDADVEGEVTGIATVGELAYVSVEDGVVGIETADGQQRWQHDGQLVEPGREGRPAIMAEGALVVGVATSNGEDLWSTEAVSGFIGNAVGNDLVVISRGSALVAVDRQTGQELWRYSSELRIFASVITEDAVVAATASDNSAFDGYVLLDAHDGRFIAGRDDVNNAQVIESEGHLVEVRSSRGASGIDPVTGDYTWEIPLGNAFFVGSRVFSLRERPLVLTADQSGAEVVALIDPATGQQRWQVRADAQLELVTKGSRYIALVRLSRITLRDPETGDAALEVVVPNGVVLADDPLVVYDGVTVVGLQDP